MRNPFFQFKKFTVHHDRCAMKVTTDACLFGAWCAEETKQEKPLTALDIGAGTGLLSLMIAQKNNLQIDALEIDKAAAEQADENIKASPWKNQIHIYQEDALKFNYTKKYDVIISNPPFYEKEIESSQAEKNKAHHGRALKLQDLLTLIKENLVPQGKFFLLLPYKRNAEIKTLFKKQGLFIEKEVVVSPSVLHAPFRLFIKGSLETLPTFASSLAIKNANDRYTDAFVQLLKDYYLYL